MASTNENSMAPVEQRGMKLTEVTFQRIMEAGINELYMLSVNAGIDDDENLVTSEDLRERLILMKRKMEGSSNTWKPLFQSVKEETKLKSESLIELMKTVDNTFQMCPVDSLSEILRKEGHLKSRNLLQEMSKRMKNLAGQKSLVIIAGETNGGKSTFLNLLLGVDILPTDVLHCTFTVCKIVYSDTYSVKTLNHKKEEEYFPCTSVADTKALLRTKAAEQHMNERALGSPFKEITLGLPADILKSGVTLVDTPGIGEDETMDNVTMNFVKSTHASAFIYIIKSDTAGGIQEDRLLSFLRAIKERYSSDTEVETFDPRAALFVCHRWDNIEDLQKEKVKINAFNKLEYVWPGFERSQLYFFPPQTQGNIYQLVNPEFVADTFMKLLKGMKQLFERASHNAIKHQYLWLKYMLQPAARHLLSMITHCTQSNDELELYFKNVAIKQNKLMSSAAENSKTIQSKLNMLSMDLKETIIKDLDLENISIRLEIHDCDEIIETCKRGNFLNDKKNRQLLDEMIIRCLLKYVDERVHARRTIIDMESQILTAIQEHLGLYRSQISRIKYSMQHGDTGSLTPSASKSSLDVRDLSIQFGSSTMSAVSAVSTSSSVESLRDDIVFDTAQLAKTVTSLLLKRKDGKSRRSIISKHEVQQSLLKKVFGMIKDGLGLSQRAEPAVYVEQIIDRVAREIRNDAVIMDSIVMGYTEWIQQCVNCATNSIPKFIDVNNLLMEEIREHRTNFQRNKNLLRQVMEDLEPSRHFLKGYGLLYMDDINAEMLAFSIEQRDSSVLVPKDLFAEHKLNDDSGFQGSGSRKRKVQSLWAKMQGAEFRINSVRERVVVKTYIYDMEDRAVFSEIASLRCLKNPHLASFLGMTRIEATGSTRGDSIGKDNITEKASAFIFNGDLVSAAVYSKRKMTNMQLFVPDFIHSLLQGLNYIHREGLVHMELNLNTVMVERLTGIVKLCQMCKPREARFPINLTTLTQTCVCLSPNVLQGHIYESTDDIYAFGLLLWELIFDDNPPYKEQRVWQLKRFIDECHPNNMLWDALIQLPDVSENILDVLKGTVLLPRGTICMPIATVQSLLVNISDEPVISHMNSRQRRHAVYRRTNSKSSDIAITSTSGTQPKMSAEALSVEHVPQRPPRKRDNFKISASIEEPIIAVWDNKYHTKDKRRQSEPALSINLSSFPSVKSKKSFFQRVGQVFSRRSSNAHLVEKLDQRDESISVNTTGSRKKSVHILEDTDRKLKASIDVKYLTPQLKQKSFSKSAIKQYPEDSKSHHRRFSLQDPSLYDHQQVTAFHDDGLDVPEKMIEKFSTNLSDTLSNNNNRSVYSGTGLMSPSFLTGSLPSLPNSERLSRKAGTDIHRTQGPTSPTHNNSKIASNRYRSLDNFTLLESKTTGSYAPVNISVPISGLRLGGSLQELPRSFDNKVSHTAAPLIVDSIDTMGVQFVHNRYVSSGHRLGISLQDISDRSHIIGPIMEDQVVTSGFEYKQVGSENNGHYRTNLSLRKHSGHRRWSSTSSSKIREKLDESLGSTSSLSSSSSSLPGTASRLSIDATAKEQTAVIGLLDVSNIDFGSNYETDSSSLDSNVITQNNDTGYNSFDYMKSQNDKSIVTSKPQAFKLHVTTNNNNMLSSSSDSFMVFSPDNSERTEHFSYEDIQNTAELPYDEYTPSPAPSVSNTAPPIPVIDFTKLFKVNDSSDDEGYPFQ